MNCACHDEPMHWNKDPRYRAGGFWKCAVKGRASAKARYDADPESHCARIRNHWATNFIYRERAALRSRRFKALQTRAARPPANPKFAAALIAVKRKGESSSRSTGQKTS